MNKTLKLTMTALAMAMPGFGSLTVGKWCHFWPLFGMWMTASLPFQLRLLSWQLVLYGELWSALGLPMINLWLIMHGAVVESWLVAAVIAYGGGSADCPKKSTKEGGFVQ